MHWGGQRSVPQEELVAGRAVDKVDFPVNLEGCEGPHCLRLLHAGQMEGGGSRAGEDVERRSRDSLVLVHLQPQNVGRAEPLE